MGKRAKDTSDVVRTINTKFRPHSKATLADSDFRSKIKDDRVVLLRGEKTGIKRTIKLHKALFSFLIFILPVQLGRHFWPNFSYVLGLRINFLSPTIYLTDILIALILSLWFLENLKTPRRLVKIILRGGGAKKNLWIVTAFLFLLINALFAQNQGAALYKLVKIIELVLLGLYVAKNKINLSLITYRLSLATIYSSLIAIFQFIKQSSLNGVFWWLGERTFDLTTPGIAKAIVGGRLLLRPYATFPHPNALAGFILVSLVLTFPFLLNKRKLLAITTILISFSRSAWLVGLGILGFWFLKKFRPLRSLLYALCFLLFVLFGLFLFLKLPFSSSEAVTQRLELTKASILMIKKSPLIGVGLGNFIVRLPEFWRDPASVRFLQPVHNIYLLIAAETGLVGLLIFGWFLTLTYKRLLNCYIVKLLKKKKKNFYQLPITNYSLLITALSAILLLGLFDHYWLTLQQTQLLFAVLLGLSWGYGHPASTSEMSRKAVKI